MWFKITNCCSKTDWARLPQDCEICGCLYWTARDALRVQGALWQYPKMLNPHLTMPFPYLKFWKLLKLLLLLLLQHIFYPTHDGHTSTKLPRTVVDPNFLDYFRPRNVLTEWLMRTATWKKKSFSTISSGWPGKKDRCFAEHHDTDSATSIHTSTRASKNL